MGADVVIVEHPSEGDPMRFSPHVFAALFKGKKSIAIDLRSHEGREVCWKMARESAIVVESFRPGVAAKLGVDYEALRAVNPNIIYASISGYGQTGPYREWPAHDLSYQGIAGMMVGQNSYEGLRALPKMPLADLSSAMFATIAILAALHVVRQGGDGQYIDISILDALVSLQGPALSRQGSEPLIEGLPGYGVYPTKDGKYLSLSIVREDHFWANLCKAIGKPELKDISAPERVRRFEEIRSTLKETFIAKTREEWMSMLGGANVPFGPVYSAPHEVLEDPQLRHRGMVVEIDDPKRGKTTEFASPLASLGLTATTGTQPPGLGEHTDEILLGLGYSKDAIKEMRGKGIINAD
jgi:crotonobetainyl-CoA:carnitine CoA-transferase CaiB-like acyl-CoA transferase